ncbi:transcription-repair coupling factor (superfamily II helicase) [Desulfonatronum thiosulfatophilum]|uniref:Transcription-repair-coupling factor n=1 Tax=Desulfonatronum thiosulfatophilum TaxID=617002 RepID=A0A1G6DRS9_9BACT|nr:transcription-repair coupling factor [Desulfonatronum thiosulfatophilum]SDB47864.1 transcription-repair coupling factor (superfamily II helicase) [Desulfonatronum thiosulfatophilum]
MYLTKDIQDFLRGRQEALYVHKSGPATQAYLAEALLNRGINVVLVLPDSRHMPDMQALVRLFSRDEEELFWKRRWFSLPAYPPEDPLQADAEAWSQRWLALFALHNASRPFGLITGVENFLPKWPPRDVVENSFLHLSQGEELSPDVILEQLVTWGYRRSSMVADVGEMARRGDILDVFPPGYDAPLRMEFFGENLESMRLFEPLRQRSIRDIPDAIILPVAPALLADQIRDKAHACWQRLDATGEVTSRGHAGLQQALERGDGFLAPGIYYDKYSTLNQWVPENTVFLLCGSSQLRPRLEEGEWAWQTHLEDVARQNNCEADSRWLRSSLIQPASSARLAWHNRRQIIFEDLLIGVDKQGVDLPEKNHASFQDLFWRPDARQRPWSTLMQSLRTWREERPQVLISFHSDHSRARFGKRLDEEGIAFNQEFSTDGKEISLIRSPLRTGMDLEWNGMLILAEDVLQPDEKKGPARQLRKKGFAGLDSFDELTTGDLLVHRDYGLGRFGGLHRVRIGDAANDYLLVEYAGEDKLYLPVDRLNLVQRYKGPEGNSPVLDRLGGGQWTKTKERARKAIEKIAQDLVEIYAYRRIAKGYAYSPMNEMYRDFEASFGFEETPDQSRAIDDVFTDMDLPQPMDRLVCGDVGFGKTEVAMRSAFRAVMDGKQVALLCPTTVLAEQHYQNFRMRMEHFPVQVAMLSRFVPKPRQKQVLEAAARGRVDILIGTHRLISDDVNLPNLGLLILDEEQRFGVKHKEKLKKLRKNVDVLTLTATPIPRTLQLSLSGIRSLSVIETPPVDRKPVQTYLLERNADMLRQALAQELERGGQVFWVHNRVQGLDQVEEYVRSLAPEARIGRAHGQMTPTALEKCMHQFWHGELDILVCTAIIESGLDFPRANTLIVDQAQMFGLGQLYQLRGRVGRSERQAYAYFVVNKLDALPESTRKRLQVILDMDYLGAGFFVAMEDLRLRGAGNILGESQSGTISKVGLELFLEMLENEVSRLKGEAPRDDRQTEMNVSFPAHIPENYIPESRDRLHFYKALSSAATDEAAQEVESEIRDRFGNFPEELETFVEVVKLKRLLSALKAARADLTPGRVVVAWSDSADQNVLQSIVPWVMQRQDRVRFLPPNRVELRFADKAANCTHLRQAVVEFSHLAMSPHSLPS